MAAAALAAGADGQGGGAPRLHLSASADQGRFVVFPSGGHLTRAPDGLFYVNGSVNGVPVRFLVDTGASTTVLTRGDALRSGVLPDPDRFQAIADTANGGTSMAWVSIAELDVDGLRVRDFSAAVASGGLNVSLLGQNWLSQLDSVTIAGDRMVLRH